MASKKWSQLSDSTKRRYKRHGVTPQQYNAGKLTPERKQEIYGKRKTSWAIDIAKQRGLESQFKNNPEAFDKLTVAQKGKLADEFNKGYVSPLSPIEDDGTLTPVDTKRFLDTNNRFPNKHYGMPLRTEAQFNAVMDFEEFMSDLFGEDWEFDWEAFRDYYKTGI